MHFYHTVLLPQGPFDADPEMPPEGARASGSHRHKERSLAALLEDPDASAFAAGMAGATQVRADPTRISRSPAGPAGARSSLDHRLAPQLETIRT